MTATIVWTTSPDKLARAIGNYGNNLTDAVFNLLKGFGPEVQGHMKQTALWTDRTGEARQNLFTEARQEGDDAVLYLITRAAHGKWLEIVLFRYAGRLEVIRPTMDLYAQRIMTQIAFKLAS